jgi:ABC-type methionine transport system permease subunit
VPVVSFTSAIAIARAIRYFGMGYLAIRYGKEAMPFIEQHKVLVVAIVVALALISYALSRVVLRHRPPIGDPK